MSIPFTPSRCPHCKKKMDAGLRIHPACIDDYAQAQAAKSARAQAKRVLMAAKVDRALTRAKRESLKSKAQWAKEAQTEFNRFIRLRDADQPCISCGRHHQGQYHARERATHVLPIPAYFLKVRAEFLHLLLVQSLLPQVSSLDCSLNSLQRCGVRYVGNPVERVGERNPKDLQSDHHYDCAFVLH